MQTLLQKATQIKMFQLIEEWKQDEESRVSFCKSKQLSIKTFTYWYKRYKEQLSVEGNAFLPVTIPARLESSLDGIEIHYPNGVRIVLPKNSDLSMVRTFINMV